MINISIEAVGSGIPLLKMNMKKETTIEEMYNYVSHELKKEDEIVLYPNYDFDNPLLNSKKSLNEVYGDVERITFALMTKILTEREILEKFYYATEGPNWKRNDNWLSDKPLNEWYGIQIHENSEDKFIVKSLNLSHNQLTGGVTKEIGNLRNLQELYLNNNQLTGEIPKEIGNISNLIEFDLSQNQLTGEIPKEVKELSCNKKF